MNVALQVATHMAIAGGSPYRNHPKAYGYVPHEPNTPKAELVGGAGTDPEGKGPLLAFFGCMLLMAAAVYIGATLGTA